MINNIEKIKARHPKYIREFMTGCTVDEKIDTHYITIEIISRNSILIKKANGNEINRVDLILNGMWAKLLLDWNYLRTSNQDWFQSHLGFTIKAFYFPCEKPLLTEYDPNLRYIFDRVIFNNVDLDPKEILADVKFPDAYAIGFKKTIEKEKNIDDIFNNGFKDVQDGKITVSELFHRMHPDTKNLYAVGEPEGFIYKYNNKIYQSSRNDERKITQEKSSYEFLLGDFIKYAKTHNYIDKIGQSYVKTVCSLFNDYIVNVEKKTHHIEKNIDASGIENPYLGHKFDIGYEYIPDQVTKALCRESELYKNIFKVLLANLQKGKDYTHCIFLSRKEVDEWNTISKFIKIRNTNI